MSSGYRRAPEGTDPPRLFPAYESTVKRAPLHPPVRVPQSISEITGPSLEREFLRDGDTDLTRFDGGDALGERIIVSGRVLDEDGRSIANALIEIWQANACGRYAHRGDQHHAPLDPHFLGVGRMATNDSGEYRFATIRPGAYPWKNHHNAWRPSHIHFSLFGPAVATRLITQMYFPGDPLLELDPIFNSVPDREARERLVARFDINLTVPEYALGYRFDFVMRGRTATPALG
ncbi:MAG TPA: protocatechuate 3,4-dioxygenase subunit beta [Candidatus Binataceae bacterium]|nr:protocatechuate 3,4-dioxygenase subunit beta [Candidatus Binataceae bacterium]